MDDYAKLLLTKQQQPNASINNSDFSDMHDDIFRPARPCIAASKAVPIGLLALGSGDGLRPKPLWCLSTFPRIDILKGSAAPVPLGPLHCITGGSNAKKYPKERKYSIWGRRKRGGLRQFVQMHIQNVTHSWIRNDVQHLHVLVSRVQILTGCTSKLGEQSRERQMSKPHRVRWASQELIFYLTDSL